MMENRNKVKTSSPNSNNRATPKSQPIQSISADLVRSSSDSDTCKKRKGKNTDKESAKEGIITIEKNAKTKTKARQKSRLGVIASYLKEYCDSSGLHGVRYLSEEHRNIVEKLYWILAITLCIAGCSYMIVKVKEKLDTTPVIVTFAESPTNVWHLPFPAVTVCPYTVSPQTVFNFTKYSNLAETYPLMLTIGGDDLLLNSYFKVLVEEIIHKISNYSTEFLWKRSTWQRKIIKGNHRSQFDVDDPETIALKSLLEEKLKELTSNGENVDNLTLENNADFRMSINEYNEIWRSNISQKLNAVHAVCEADSSFSLLSEALKLDMLNESALTFLQEIAPASKFLNSRSSFRVKWHREDILANETFKFMWAREGLCLTFNMMDNKEIYNDQVINHDMFPHRSEPAKGWNSDSGYSSKAEIDAFPRRPTGVGRGTGLHMRLDAKSRDYDYLCHRGEVSGYKIIFHRPEDQPQSQRNFVIEIPFEKDVSISVKPSVMTISPGLENYAAEKRQCYFSYENHLKYFKFYSKNNCELECLTNATLKDCGCVAFYMPRNSSTKICGKGMEYCIKNSSSELNYRRIKEELEKVSKDSVGSLNLAIKSPACGCLPSCATITYEADATMNDYDEKNFYKAWGFSERFVNNIDEKSTYISIFFKSPYFIASRRSELYGLTEFLANCGGILGLFCGFSIVSLVEFVYFLTLRPWSNIYRRRTTARKIHQNLSLT